MRRSLRCLWSVFLSRRLLSSLRSPPKSMYRRYWAVFCRLFIWSVRAPTWFLLWFTINRIKTRSVSWAALHRRWSGCYPLPSPFRSLTLFISFTSVWSPSALPFIPYWAFYWLWSWSLKSLSPHLCHRRASLRYTVSACATCLSRFLILVRVSFHPWGLVRVSVITVLQLSSVCSQTHRLDKLILLLLQQWL